MRTRTKENLLFDNIYLYRILENGKKCDSVSFRVVCAFDLLHHSRSCGHPVLASSLTR